MEILRKPFFFSCFCERERGPKPVLPSPLQNACPVFSYRPSHDRAKHTIRRSGISVSWRPALLGDGGASAVQRASAPTGFSGRNKRIRGRAKLCLTRVCAARFFRPLVSRFSVGLSSQMGCFVENKSCGQSLPC